MMNRTKPSQLLVRSISLKNNRPSKISMIISIEMLIIMLIMIMMSIGSTR